MRLFDIQLRCVKIAVLAVLLSCLAMDGMAGVATGLKLGIDRLRENGFHELRGMRVGLVTNPSAVDIEGKTTLQILHEAPEVNLVSLFGPEHGVYGKVPAGKYVESHRDEETGLFVHSLYGKTRRPTKEMLDGLDAVVFDMQDIGARSYTYISTLGYLMEEAARHGIVVVVLDRPNPLGGVRIEGPRLEEKFRTFVGLYDLPYVHGLTVGELALWANRKHLETPCRLIVIPMSGWKRGMTWDDTGLQWISSSPNIPNFKSVLGYVATGLLGEIGVTNGANDRWPFELIASEGLDAEEFCRTMSGYGFPGVRFEPFSFHPQSGPWQKNLFSGAKLEIDPKAEANLTAIPFYALPLLRKRFPKREYFRNRTKDPVLMFDKINGSDKPRLQLLKGVGAKEIVAGWDAGVAAWREERKPYLIYDL